jgi:hypothetical protein
MTNKDMFDESFPDTKQVGGKHYKQFIIQPWTFIIIKYVCRYLSKGKTVEDIEKIKHYCDLEIQHLEEKKLDMGIWGDKKK